MALYVPLDVNYAEDDKIIEVGPLAELLFIRSLAFAKRVEKDGRIADSQMPTVAARIPKANTQAERLYESGLWERNGTGLYISAWLKRNKPVEDVNAAKSSAGTIGNHKRWHLSGVKPPSPECEFCVKEGLVR
jgi:hypothetical protein